MPKNNETETVAASDLRAGYPEGDYLAGLDNGYVIDVEEDPDIRGDFNTRLGGDEFVCVTFNTNDGDEAYLLCPADMQVTIKARG